MISKNQCPVPPSYIKFISVMRIFWVPWKVHNKFIMKWRRWWFSYDLVYAYILGFLKSKFADFLSMSKSSFTVIYRNKIFIRNFTHKKTKSKLAIIQSYNFISMDKKFIMTIKTLNELYMSYINKVQNRWDLSLKKTSFSPSCVCMFRGTQHRYQASQNYAIVSVFGIIGLENPL